MAHRPTIALLLSVAYACSPAPKPPTQIQPAPTATPSSKPAVDDACARAAQHRQRVPGLLAEGRLHRTLRVIAFADDLCPNTRGESEAHRAAAHEAMDLRGQSGRTLFERGEEEAAAGHVAAAQRFYDRAITALEAETGQSLEVGWPFLESYRAGAVAVAKDGRHVALTHGRFVSLVDARSGLEHMQLPLADEVGEHHQFYAVVFSAAGDRIFAVSEEHVHIWARATGELLRLVPIEGANIWNGIALSRDENTLWAGSPNERINHYDLETGKTLHEIRERSFVVRKSTGGRLLPTGVSLPTVGSSNHEVVPPPVRLQLVDIETAGVVATIPTPNEIGSATITPDGAQIAIASGSSHREVQIELRTLPRGRLLWRSRHEGATAFQRFEVSADGRVLHLRSSGLWTVRGLKFLHKSLSSNDRLFDGHLISGEAPFVAWDWTAKKQVSLVGARLPSRDGNAGKLVPHLLWHNIYAQPWTRDVLAPDGTKVATEWLVGDNTNSSLWGVTTDAGQLELAGVRSVPPICRVGRLSFPFSLCSERVLTRDLRRRALAGDKTLHEP